MKQRGKRMGSFLLPVALILSFFATMPQEGMKVQDILGEYFECTVTGDNVTITGYKNPVGESDLDFITIFKNAGKNLVKIDELAFRQCSDLDDITILKSCNGFITNMP